MYSSPVRHSPPIRASSYCAAVRLACVRPTASVHSEPGSNSSLKITCPKTNYFSCRNSITGNVSLALKQLIHCLIKRLQDGQSSIPAGALTIYLRILSKNFESGLSAIFVGCDVSVVASRPLYGGFSASSTPHFGAVDSAASNPNPKVFAEASRLLCQAFRICQQLAT